MPDIAFHSISTRPITLKLVPTSLGIITTVYQGHRDVSSIPLKATCIMMTTSFQFPGSGLSSRFVVQCHILRFLALITEGPLARCSRSHVTASTK